LASEAVTIVSLAVGIQELRNSSAMDIIPE
jgi:hypothetical protein